MSTKRILIVDDEESILTVLKAALKKLGHTVDVAKNGFMALDYVKQQQYSLVVTDFNMGEMDGLELIESIRYQQPNAQIILITAYGFEGLERAAERLQTFRYLTKPLHINTFRQVVQEALDNQPQSNKPRIFSLSDRQYQRIHRLLEQFRSNINARCILLASAEGESLVRIGDADVSIEELSTLLGGGLASLFEAGRRMDGDLEAINLTYREGKNEYLYALNVGRELMMTIIIGRGSYSSRLGSVWYYAQQAVKDVQDTLETVDELSADSVFDADVVEAFDMELDKLFSGS